MSTEKIKPTNLGPAYYRSFTDIPYSKELAIKIDARMVATLFGTNVTSKRMVPVMEGRYKAIDALIKRSGIKQVVEIAAGWTPRGMIFTRDSSFNYIETDQDAFEMKQKIAFSEEILGEKRANLHCVLLDVVTGVGLGEVMKLLKPDKVVIVHEGLFRYLTHEQKAKVVENVKAILKKHGGIYITPDIFVEDEKKDFAKLLAGDMTKYNDDTSKRTGTNINANYFQNQKEATEFFEKLGLETKIHSFSELVKEYSCVKIAGLDEKTVMDYNNTRKIYEMRLKQ